MSAQQGLMSFPGIEQIVDVSIPFIHGISPAVAVVTMAPQAGYVGEGGNLVVSFAGESITLQDCKVDYASFERTTSGLIWRMSIFDRRWRWVGLGKISGRYNVRDGNGEIIEATEKTPRELLKLCLEAIEEEDFILDDLPEDVLPAVDWDYDTPADAMAALCDQLSLIIVLRFDNRVQICRKGQGADLPSDGIYTDSLTINPPEKPDKLVFVCAPTRFQADFELEAVGEEEDGTIKPIEELSYKPTAGWEGIDTPWMMGTGSDPKVRERAKANVFRKYRVKFPCSIPGHGQVQTIDEVEFSGEQVDTITRDSEEIPAPAAVYGVWFPNQHDNKNIVSELKPANYTPSQYLRGFSFDTARGLVEFNDQVYRNAAQEGDETPGSLTAAAATLRLRTSATVRDADTRAIIRHEIERDLGGNFGTVPKYLRQEEIALTNVPTYDDSYAVSEITKNEDEVDDTAEHYLDAAEAEFETPEPRTRSYVGLRAIELDGAINQVTFSISAAGATTTASRNTEQTRKVRPYKERRHIERQRSDQDRVEHLQRMLRRLR